MLTSFVSEARDDWDNHLPFIMMAYRATPHDSTMCTPNELMLGREVHLPVDILTSPPPGTFDCCLPQYVEWVQNALQNSFDFVLEKTNSVVRRQKAYYDRGLKPRKFQKHDWVWRYYPPKADRKMNPSWIGPYLILDKLSDYTYKIQMNQTSKVIVAHVDDLKSCENTTGFVNWDTCTDETRTGMQNTGVRDTDTDIPTQTTQNIEQHENTKEPPKRSKYGREEKKKKAATERRKLVEKNVNGLFRMERHVCRDEEVVFPDYTWNAGSSFIRRKRKWTGEAVQYVRPLE
ncbi:hypothetical protein FSP39_012221 [Pinctada imbricata]|uniref:Integrase p58-like C-terminal domain-containing protein n=1 Tax=Pinctada imbricata TaxID=66713 RepID=A0AA88YLI7_PINIB|nr:hypothetical protein FSP39_012221 [Pinctada imbricata]